MGAGDRQSDLLAPVATLRGPLPVQPGCNVSQLRHGGGGAAFRARPDHQGRRLQFLQRKITTKDV